MTISDDDLFGEPAAPDPAAPAPVTPELPPPDLRDLLAELGGRGEAFTVHDEGSAAWVVNKVLGFDEQLERITAQYLALCNGIKADKERFTRWFVPQLEAWFDQQPKRGRSLRLLTGTLQRRTVVGGRNLFVVKPEVGAFYLWPAWMLHCVYPFRGAGVRRSVSVNLSLV